MKANIQITLAQGEIVAAGKSMNPINPRTWLFIGKGYEGVEIEFTGKDRPLAEKIAVVIEAHRSQESAH
jgi:hypothetical protein